MRDVDQQALAVGADTRPGTQGIQGIGEQSCLCAFGRGLTFTGLPLLCSGSGPTGSKSTGLCAISVVEWFGVWLTVWLCATAVLAFWEWLRAALLSIKTSEGPVLTSRYALVVYSTALGLAAFVITVLLNQPAPDIVYKAF